MHLEIESDDGCEARRARAPADGRQQLSLRRRRRKPGSEPRGRPAVALLDRRARFLAHARPAGCGRLAPFAARTRRRDAARKALHRALRPRPRAPRLRRQRGRHAAARRSSPSSTAPSRCSSRPTGYRRSASAELLSAETDGRRGSPRSIRPSCARAAFAARSSTSTTRWSGFVRSRRSKRMRAWVRRADEAGVQRRGADQQRDAVGGGGRARTWACRASRARASRCRAGFRRAVKVLELAAARGRRHRRPALHRRPRRKARRPRRDPRRSAGAARPVEHAPAALDRARRACAASRARSAVTPDRIAKARALLEDDRRRASAPTRRSRTARAGGSATTSRRPPSCCCTA